MHGDPITLANPGPPPRAKGATKPCPRPGRKLADFDFCLRRPTHCADWTPRRATVSRIPGLVCQLTCRILDAAIRMFPHSGCTGEPRRGSTGCGGGMLLDRHVEARSDLGT
ncbi:uncharacterized protein N7518_002932 [Penicillium psychrosexuale]|uniref:uncharacterized protein n=1 Tax=Penicillium psychrosexuale TaxID=1002107 RepID=UPI002545062B|nr:uncharacterized protein N7518_002932 [Penicillium psychrosexuale]KAJ5800864.1 hypothetical protein N7518_002932 [Penicillium psychrosexuale]